MVLIPSLERKKTKRQFAFFCLAIVSKHIFMASMARFSFSKLLQLPNYPKWRSLLFHGISTLCWNWAKQEQTKPRNGRWASSFKIRPTPNNNARNDNNGHKRDGNEGHKKESADAGSHALAPFKWGQSEAKKDGCTPHHFFVFSHQSTKKGNGNWRRFEKELDNKGTPTATLLPFIPFSPMTCPKKKPIMI